jgi:hypothetical protein
LGGGPGGTSTFGFGLLTAARELVAVAELGVDEGVPPHAVTMPNAMSAEISTRNLK